MAGLPESLGELYALIQRIIHEEAPTLQAIAAPTSRFQIPINYAPGGAVDATTVFPEVAVPLSAGQTAAIVSVFSHLTSGTSIDVQLRVNGVAFGAPITVTTAEVVTARSRVLAAGDRVDLVTSNPVGTPKDLTFAVWVEHTA